MKIFLTLSVFLSGCTVTQNIVSPFTDSNKVNETNYMKTPCIWDGAIVKKKPKVINVL